MMNNQNVEPVSKLPPVTLTEKEKQYYRQIFSNLNKDGFVEVNSLVPFLTKSGLPMPQLGQIWEIVNVNQQNKLNPNAFSTALRLVALAQSGRPISLQQLATVQEIDIPRFQDIPLPSDSGNTAQPVPFSMGGGQGVKTYPLSNLGTGTPSSAPPSTSSPFSSAPSTTAPTSLNALLHSGSGTRSTVSSAAQGSTSSSFASLLGPYGGSTSTSSPFSSTSTNSGLPPPGSAIGGIGGPFGSNILGGVGGAGGFGGLPGTGASATLGGVFGAGGGGGLTPAGSTATGFAGLPSASPTLGAGVGYTGAGGYGTSGGQSSNDPWLISEKQRANFKNNWQTVPKTNPTLLSGIESKNYFEKSNLNSTDLAKIWKLSDRNADNFLDEDEFILAMFLIQKKLSGQAIPDVLPESLIQSYKIPPYQQQQQHPSSFGASNALVLAIEPAKDQWTVSPSDKQRYTEIFAQVDLPRSGKISGLIAKDLFGKSNLPPQILGQIWVLSDMNKDGMLDKLEFCIAMHLIDCVRLKSMTLPNTLPQSILDSLTNEGLVNIGNVSGMFATPGYSGGQSPFGQTNIQGGVGVGGQYGNQPYSGSNLFGQTPQPGVVPVLFGNVNDAELQEKRRKEEQERQKTASLKEDIINRLNQKADKINKIRAAQQQNLDQAASLSVQEQKVERTKKVTKELELNVERQKIRIAAINDKIQLVKTQANTIRDQKRGLDAIIIQRQSQFQEEQSLLNNLGQKLAEDQATLEKQKEEIIKLRNELALAKNQKLHAEQRKAQIELQRRQEAEEAERRRAFEEAERRRLAAEAEERRRQEEEQKRLEEERRRAAAEAEERKQQLERERQEIEKQKAELEKQKKVMEGMKQTTAATSIADSTGSAQDYTVNYEKFIDDFGTRREGPSKGEAALYFGTKHPEFPLGFYPELQDFGCLIFSFQNAFPSQEQQQTLPTQPQQSISQGPPQPSNTLPQPNNNLSALPQQSISQALPQSNAFPQSQLQQQQYQQQQQHQQQQQQSSDEEYSSDGEPQPTPSFFGGGEGGSSLAAKVSVSASTSTGTGAGVPQSAFMPMTTSSSTPVPPPSTVQPIQENNNPFPFDFFGGGAQQDRTGGGVGGGGGGVLDLSQSLGGGSSGGGGGGGSVDPFQGLFAETTSTSEAFNPFNPLFDDK